MSYLGRAYGHGGLWLEHPAEEAIALPYSFCQRGANGACSSFGASIEIV